jgi:hypothetical protein
MKKVKFLIGAAVVALASSVASFGATLLPVADTFIRNDGTGGPTSDLVVKRQSSSTNNRVAFVRFSGTGVGGNVASASLHFRVVQHTGQVASQTLQLFGIANNATNEAFNAATLTWSNSGYTNAADSNNVNDALFHGGAPLATATLLSSHGSGSVITFSSAALTAFLNANNNANLTFVLTSATSSTSAFVVFGSMENASFAPVLTIPAGPPPGAVVRGPYLQNGSPSAVTVRWRTSTATDSRVRYGTTQGNLTLSASSSTLKTDHEVRLTGLSANTRYYYSVGNAAGSLAGNDANHFFVTHPPAGTAKATRVWVLGDSGTANANAQAVRNAYTNYTGTRHTDLWLMLGDNAYTDGTDAQFQAAVFDMYPEMLRKSVLWSARGNHEYFSSVYYGVHTFPTQGEAGGVPSSSEAYYSFDYGNIHFICLDSFGSNRSATGAMATWLQQDLAANTRPWVIAFWHHPPYSKGAHNSDTETQLIDMRQNFLPLLEGSGVDLVLSGHSHSYERTFLLDGHYGASGTFAASHKVNGGSGRENGSGAYQKPAGSTPHDGAVYVVAGSSGQATGGALNHPAMYISLNNLGSLVLDVNGNRLDVKFLRETGAVSDYFTILKGN